MSLSFWTWCENFHFCQVFCVANRGAFEPPPFRGFGEDIYGRRIVFSGLWLKPDVLHIGGKSSALKQKGHKLRTGFAVNQKLTLFFAEHDFLRGVMKKLSCEDAFIIPRIQIQRQHETDKEEISNDDEGKDEGCEEETRVEGGPYAFFYGVHDGQGIVRSLLKKKGKALIECPLSKIEAFAVDGSTDIFSKRGVK